MEDVMKLSFYGNVQTAVGVILVALSVGSATAAGDVVGTSDPASFSHSYGRAGGLVGSDRITALGKATGDGKQVGITYDKDVAERTNMPRGDGASGNVGIAYDKDVAERTNMQRAAKPDPAIKAVGVDAQRSN
jgi:hypothetical protein